MKFLAAATLAAGLLVGSAASAAVYQVSIWTGAPDGVQATTIADLAHMPTGLASATFTFTGDINWRVDTPQNHDASENLFSDFLDNGTVSNFASPRGSYADVVSFLGSSLSVAGDAYSTYFLIQGNYSGSNVHGSINHDDGASVYDYTGAAVYSHPDETSEITGLYSLPDGSHPFTVAYVEGNGSPSVLEVTSLGVPEPASWALMLVGFGGLGAMLRRGRQAGAATA